MNEAALVIGWIAILGAMTAAAGAIWFGAAKLLILAARQTQAFAIVARLLVLVYLRDVRREKHKRVDVLLRNTQSRKARADADSKYQVTEV